jgi:pimeloyl-ACP methyl ester carboxylesterase
MTCSGRESRLKLRVFSGKEFTRRRIAAYRDRGISYRWEYPFEDLSLAFRATPLAHFFADMFSERNDHADLESIILQFQALAKPDADDHYSRISCPTVILSGSEDGTHSSAAALKAHIPGCEMKVLYGAGHACQIEQPWEFDRHIIEFLKKHDLFPANIAAR